MSISPDLFNSVLPPAVWVTLAKPESGEHDTRLVTIRVQCEGRRSVSTSEPVSRYCSESSIMRAVSDVMYRLESAQRVVTREDLHQAMVTSIRLYVDPF